MKKKTDTKTIAPFSERHPKLNTLIGLLLVLVIVACAAIAIYYGVQYLGKGISNLTDWLSKIASKLDAVVIVALITGAVSITGVIISSIFSKTIEYRKARQEYLAKKREEPYAGFIDMVYKIQQNAKDASSYTEQDMINDISSFSKNITLWGSPDVVKKWVKFRENGMNPRAAIDNVLLIEEIMNEMRKDMGLKKVKRGNLLAFFVNDIKSVIRNKQR